MGLKLTETTNDRVAKVIPTNGGSPGPAFNATTFNAITTAQAAMAAIRPEQQPEQTANVAKRERKIALVGTAPSSRHLAPYNDPSWEIWACSAGNMGQVPRADAWFEIHSNLLWPEHEHYGRPYVEWLKKQPFKIYAQDQSIIPNAVPLPMRELLEEFGPYFFTSSFAWMLAMAMREGATEIALYGIDMASRDEYILQRPGAYFFFVEAKRRGIKITAPHESDIMQPPALYGFSDSTPFGRKILAREKELKDRVAGMKSQRDQLNASITYLEGALEDVDYVKSIWTGVDGRV